MAVLAVLAPVGFVVPPLALSAAAAVVVAAVAVWDWVVLRRIARQSANQTAQVR